jgi:hypothetical protein
MKNKYSLNAESYGISKVKWREIRFATISLELDSIEVVKRYKLYDTIKDGKIALDEALCKKRVWFLYDILLQERYNHLYKREKLVNPKVGDYVYCNHEGFGRGEIMTIKPSDKIMFIRFGKRKHQSLCSSVDMVTIHDEVKRKITRI